MTDPEGGELCAFVREDVPDYRLHEVVADAVDHHEVGRRWGDVSPTVGHTEPMNHSKRSTEPLSSRFEAARCGCVSMPSSTSTRARRLECRKIAA